MTGPRSFGLLTTFALLIAMVPSALLAQATPTVAVVNTANDTLLPPGSAVAVGTAVTLRGARFAPGGEAVIYLDNIKSSYLAIVPVGPAGDFQASVKVPMTPPGPHKFLIHEAGPVTTPPENRKYVETSVPVYVQAAAR